SLASRTEPAADGAAFLDAEGVAHLVESEAALATALVARAARVGLAARAGIGTSMTVARLAAARATDGTPVVPAGTECGFLAPLPLTCLAPPDDLMATLERWGVRRLGDLARLPIAEVAARLGPPGAMLVRRARGEDARPLAPISLAGLVEEGISLAHPLHTLEPLLLVRRPRPPPLRPARHDRAGRRPARPGGDRVRAARPHAPARRSSSRRAPARARRTDARRENDPHLPARRSRGTTAPRRDRARRAH